MLAAIPYTTFPTIELGPLNLRTFGFVVAIGVLIGAWLAARYGEEHGLSRDTTYSLAMRMVLAGVIGSRITWVLTHLDDIDSPVDVIAIWEGGLQFLGGFLFAVLLGYPVYRKWNRLTRWVSLDGYAYGLTIGLAIGRIACYSVGEHFGRETSFFLGTRYDGGSVREHFIGDKALVEGMVFHHTALYELIYLLALFVGLTWLLYWRKERPGPGTAMGIFCVWYAVFRFWSDSLRVSDERVLGMTGAQWMCLGLIIVGIWVLTHVRRRLAVDVADEMPITFVDEPAAVDDSSASEISGSSEMSEEPDESANH